MSGLEKTWAVVMLAATSAAVFAAQPSGEWYDYGEVKAYVSPDQSKMYQVEFYQGYGADEWQACTAPVKSKVTVTGVDYEGRNEIKSFTVWHPKFGKETFEVNLSDFPMAHRWLLSTLVKKGKAISITSRGCGSGGVSYLTAIGDVAK